METERKDTEPKVIQPAESMDAKYNERPPQSTVIQGKTKKELHKEMQKEENITMMRLVQIT